MKYRIDYTNEDDQLFVYECDSLADARVDARYLSNRMANGVYIIARDGDEDVGQVVYYNGHTNYTEGRIK